MKSRLMTSAAVLFFVPVVAANAQQQASNYDHLKPLEFTIGKWVGEYEIPIEIAGFPAGTKVVERISARWLLRKNYIVSDFTQEADGRKRRTGKEITRWDRLAGKLKHSIFDLEGSGEGQWHKDGDRMVLTWTYTDAENGITGKSILGKIDDNAYSWQLVQIKVDGESVPDWPKVTYKRASSD